MHLPLEESEDENIQFVKKTYQKNDNRKEFKSSLLGNQ